MLWVLGTGAPWRDVPERYGPWQTVYDRFKRWREDGTFDRIAQAVRQRMDGEGLIDVMDGVKIKRPTTGRPRQRPKRLAGDKAYSSKRIRCWLRSRHIRPIIPTRSDERRNPQFDSAAYRQRNVVERCVGWLKGFRRIGTRFEKLAVNYAAMLTLGMIRIMLSFESPQRTQRSQRESLDPLLQRRHTEVDDQAAYEASAPQVREQLCPPVFVRPANALDVDHDFTEDQEVDPLPLDHPSLEDNVRGLLPFVRNRTQIELVA